MSKKSFFIQISPLDYFFFGGARTFGGDNANYYVRSRHYPQQSGVVGLLRHALLQLGQNIGPDSFSAQATQAQQFGVLDSLSPVFLYHNPDQSKSLQAKQCYWVHSMDAHQPEAPFEIAPLADAWLLGQNAKGEASWENMSGAGGYDAKQSLVDAQWINHKGDCQVEEAIFHKLVRTGITKQRKSSQAQDQEKAFYKQEVLKFQPHWSFGVLATFDTSTGFNPLQLDGLVLPFGGERSMCKLTVGNSLDWAQLETQLVQGEAFQRAGQTGLVLLSDAYLDPAVYAHCWLAISNGVDFQNIHTPSAGASTINYADLAKQKSQTQPYKSGKYNLMGKGSVFFPKNTEVEKALLAATQFRNIGYNYFIKQHN